MRKLESFFNKLSFRGQEAQESREDAGREYLAESLEARVLYSGTVAPDAPVDEEVVHEAPAENEPEAVGADGSPVSAIEAAQQASAELEQFVSEGIQIAGGETDIAEDQGVVILNPEVFGDLGAISQAAAEGAFDAAAERWSVSGVLTDDQEAALGDVSVQVADLEGDLLVIVSDDNSTVLLDIDAAGRAWFVDGTPLDDSEFTDRVSLNGFRAESGNATQGVDVLTILMEAQGSLLGVDGVSAAREVSATGLEEGLRRIPIADEALTNPDVVTTSLVADLANAAAQRWEQSGLSDAQLEALVNIEYRVVDLQSGIIGSAEDGVISIDIDAAAKGWFVDLSPEEDSEFGVQNSATSLSATEGSAAGGIDLLSVILHEQGHVLGLEHVEDSESVTVMTDVFSGGDRRILLGGQAEGAVAGSLEGEHFATIAYWEMGADRESLVDIVTSDGAAQTLTGGSSNKFTASSSNVAPNPVPKPDAETNGTFGSIYINGGTAPKITGSANDAFKMTSTNSFTFEGWLRTTGSGVIGGDRHNSPNNPSYNGWYLLVTGGGALQFYSNFSSGGGASAATTSMVVNDDTPHHFAAVWDHTASEMRLYLDGDLEDTASSVTPGSYTPSSFAIGGRSTGTDGTTNDTTLSTGSRLDELRFSDVALAPSEFLSATADTTAPRISSLSPADDAPGVSPVTNLVVTFDEPIALKSGGTITITDTDDGSGTQVIDLLDATSATVSGNDLIINPAIALEPNTSYEIVIDENAIEDLAASPNGYSGTASGEWTFTTSTVPAVLVDINADGTNRTATTTHFEAATGVAAGTFSGDTVNVFGGTEEGGAYSETVNNVTLAISNKGGGADNWFGSGSDNNLLDDGFFNNGTTPQTITISGDGLNLTAGRRFELYLFAGRSQGHDTTFKFDADNPGDPSGGVAMDTSAPVIGGNETLGTAKFIFETGSIVPPSLVVEWNEHSPNVDPVFSGFALRDVGAGNTAPEITDDGLDEQAVGDNATIRVFNKSGSELTITDADANESLTVVVTITDGANRGDFTNASGWTQGTSGTDITYTRVFDDPGPGAAASAAQSAVRALDFNPRENAIAPGTTEETFFTVSVTDSASSVATTDADISVITTSINDAPTATDNDYSVSEDDGNATLGNVIADDTGDGADSDPDTSDTLEVSAINGVSADVGSTVTLASGATVKVLADGTFDYDPNGQFESLAAGEETTDTFTYTVTDGASYTPVDDTYGRRNDGTAYGSEDDILVKKDRANGSGGTTRKGVIEFDIGTGTGLLATEATLELTVSNFNQAGGSDFYVWGLNNGQSVEDFDEASANYATFTPPFDDSGDGTNNSSAQLFGGGASLGTFNLSDTTEVGDVVTFTSPKLIDFINADSNGTVTFILTRALDDSGLNSGFASKEHPTLAPPTLKLINASDTADVTVTITGTNDAPEITGGQTTGMIAETADVVGGTDADPTPATGTVTFGDVDLSDTHTAVVTGASASVTGGSITLTAAQEAALLDNLSVAVSPDSTGTVSGEVDWIYTVPNSEIDFLAAGETVEVTTTVAVTDGQTAIISFHDLGGQASPGNITTQTDPTSTVELINFEDGTDTGIDFSISGANGLDVRTGTVTRPPATGTPAGDIFLDSGIDLNDGLVNEGGNGGAGSTTFTFTGLDPDKLYDFALYGDRNASADGVERFTLNGAESATNSSSTGIVDDFITDMETRPNAVTGDVVRWTNIVVGADGTITIDIDPEVTSPSNIAYLSGFRLVEQATDTQDLVITITGTNDAPVIAAGDTSTLTETDDPLMTSGTLNVEDIDSDDMVSASITAVSVGGTGTTTSGAGAAATIGGREISNAELIAMMTPSVATQVIDGNNTTGTINWAFDSGSEAFNELAEGETLELTYTVTASDDSGATNDTATETVTITINGTNDQPEITPVPLGFYGAENNTQDSSGNANHGTANGTGFGYSTSVPSAISDRSTRSFNLTGGNSNDHLLLPTDFTGTAQSTGTSLSLWVQTASGIGSDYVFSAGNSGNNTPIYGIQGNPSADSKMRVFYRNDAGDTASATGSATVFGTGWHHLVLTDDGTTARVYVDGSSIPDIELEYPTGAMTVDRNAIGALIRSSNFGYLAGQIDEVAFFDEVLTTADIAALYGGADPGGITGNVTETDGELTATGKLNVVDEDLSDTVTITVDSVAVDTGSSTFSGTNPLAPATLETMMAVAPTTALNADPAAGTNFEWTFTSGSSGDEAFNFLAEGETLVLNYTLKATDSSGATTGESTMDTQVVTITITGTNDAPVIAAGDTSTLTESDSDPLADTGSLNFTDVDLTDGHTLAKSRTATTWSGGTSLPTGLEAALDSAFTVGLDPDSTGTGNGVIDWAFSLADTAVDFLAKDETLAISYEVTVTDDDGTPLSDTETVVVTITGVNDAPVLGAGVNNFNDVGISQLDNDGDLVSYLLNGQGIDVDNDTADAEVGIAVTGETITGAGSGVFQYQLEADAGTTTWTTFTPTVADSLLLRPEDRVRFLPDGANVQSGTITFRAWDQTTGSAGDTADTGTNGGTTPFSADFRTSSVVIAELIKDGTEIVYAPANGEVNTLSVTFDSVTNELVFTDTTSAIQSGFDGGGTREVRIGYTSGEDLTIETGDENDIVTIDLTGSGFDGNLTVNGEDGQDKIIYKSKGIVIDDSDSVDFTAEEVSFALDSSLTVGTTSANTGGITVDATGDGSAGSGTGTYTGIDLFRSSLTVLGSGEVDMTGEGGSAGSFNSGIVLRTGSSILTEDGGISLQGSVQGSNASYSSGVLITGSTVEQTGTSASGVIDIDGTGGGTGALNTGVTIDFTSAVTARGTTAIEIDGTGAGNGYGYGVRMARASTLSAEEGNVTIVGDGGTGGNFNVGISLEVKSGVSVTGDGDIALEGTGGGTGLFNSGVALHNGGASLETGTGSITIVGVAGAGTSYNAGVTISASTLKQTVDPGASGETIKIEGTGGGTGVLNAGVVIDFSSEVTALGDTSIDIDGTASDGSSYGYGVKIARATTLNSVDGDVTLDGEGGSGGHFNIGVSLENKSVVDVTGDGNITVTGTGGDGVLFNSGVALHNGGASLLTNSGAILVTGTSGTGTSYNKGLQIAGAGSAVRSTGGGNITLSGTSRGTASLNVGLELTSVTVDTTGGVILTGTGSSSASGVHNRGIYLLYSSITGTNSLSITGNGGTGSHFNEGVRVLGGSLSSGALTLTGTAAGTSGLFNSGVYLLNVNLGGVTAGSITGIGGTGTGYNHGIFMQGGNYGIFGGGANTTGTAGGGATSKEKTGAGFFL